MVKEIFICVQNSMSDIKSYFSKFTIVTKGVNLNVVISKNGTREQNARFLIIIRICCSFITYKNKFWELPFKSSKLWRTLHLSSFTKNRNRIHIHEVFIKSFNDAVVFTWLIARNPLAPPPLGPQYTESTMT